jgi:hypothetical protein
MRWLHTQFFGQSRAGAIVAGAPIEIVQNFSIIDWAH